MCVLDVQPTCTKVIFVPRSSTVHRQRFLYSFHRTLFRKVLGDATTVIHIDNAPPPLQPLAVRPPIARGPAVVYIGHGEPARRPELNVEAKRRRGGRCGSSMNLYKRGGGGGDGGEG